MWIIKHNENIEIRANDPKDLIASVLIRQNPGATIFRSIEPCINAVNLLLFAIYSEPGDLIEYSEPAVDKYGNPILDENGKQIENIFKAEGPSKTFSAENKARIDGLFLIIENKNGDEIARFELEVIYGA